VWLWLGFAATGFAKPITFVLDLDGVVVYELKPDQIGSTPPDRILSSEGKKYRLQDGAENYFAALSQIPDAKVIVFSAGPLQRNRELLKQIHLPGNPPRTALDVVDRVLSGKDVDRANHKDLTSPALGQNDIEDTLLLDDTAANSAAGQESNLVDLSRVSPEFRGWRYREDIDEPILSLLRQGKAAEARERAQQIFSDRNQLAYGLGVVDAALELSRTQPLSLRAAAAKLQWKVEPNGSFVALDPDRRNPDFYRRGFARMKAQNPNYRPTQFRESTLKALAGPPLDLFTCELGLQSLGH
jgi:hypothetical protein